MSKLLKQYFLAWLFVAASFAFVLALWSRMPEVVPVHWNARGEVNGTMAKPWGPLIGPLSGLGLVALLAVCPLISPKEFPMARFQRVYSIIVTALAGFLFVVTVAVTLAGAGLSVDVARIIGVAIGVLFMLIGNFMGKLTPNFFAGIRTPWTLASEEVWFRTHRLAGKLFFGAGLGAVLASLVSDVAGFVTIMAGTAVAAIGSMVYSYLVYRRIPPRSTS